MAERSVLALPSDDVPDLAITMLTAATSTSLNDETVTVAPRYVRVGMQPNVCFDTLRREM